MEIKEKQFNEFQKFAKNEFGVEIIKDDVNGKEYTFEEMFGINPNKEKQVEEMAQLIADNCTIHKVYVNKHYPDRQKDMYYSLAEELLKHYQPKFIENSIVISREEYEKLKLELAIEKKRADESYTQKEVEEIIASKERIKSKETAEKIIDYVYKVTANIVLRDKLAKQFGVEINNSNSFNIDEFNKGYAQGIKDLKNSKRC